MKSVLPLAIAPLAPRNLLTHHLHCKLEWFAQGRVGEQWRYRYHSSRLLAASEVSCPLQEGSGKTNDIYVHCHGPETKQPRHIMPKRKGNYRSDTIYGEDHAKSYKASTPRDGRVIRNSEKALWNEEETEAHGSVVSARKYDSSGLKEQSYSARRPTTFSVAGGSTAGRGSKLESHASTGNHSPHSYVTREAWQVQKTALLKKFGSSGWSPRKRLSPDALEGIRTLRSQYPDKYTTPVLAEHFQVSPEAIRRILKSKWKANEEEEAERRRRWDRRGENIWGQMVEIGIKPPKKWRVMGVGKANRRSNGQSPEGNIPLREQILGALKTRKVPWDLDPTTEERSIVSSSSPLSERIL